MAKKVNKTSEGFNEILLYATPNGSVKMEIYCKNLGICSTSQNPF